MALTPAERAKLYRQRHPEKVLAYRQSEQCRHNCRDATARWRARNPRPKKPLPLPLTRSELEEKRLRRQATYQNKRKAKTNGYIPCFDFSPPPLDSRCFNCSTVAKLHVDHDHITGRYRGYLCVKCNMGIGQLGDTVEALERALRYLRSTEN